jgi:hypothetical protein
MPPRGLQPPPREDTIIQAAWLRLCSEIPLVNVKKIRMERILSKPPKRGRAPIGRDGHPIQIHHTRNPHGPFIEVTRTQHNALPRPHPPLTRAERRHFNSARRDYWRRQWDSGRFDSW